MNYKKWLDKLPSTPLKNEGIKGSFLLDNQQAICYDNHTKQAKIGAIDMKKRLFSVLMVLLLTTTLILGALPALAAKTITVSVKPADHWDDVYLYVWDDQQNAMTQWPGLPMRKGNNGWWTLQIPAGYTNVIANNAYATGEQTLDLKMDGSADCWLIVTDQVPDTRYQGIVYTDAACTQPFGGSVPSVPSVSLDSMALVGSGIPGIEDWNPGDPAGDMTKVSDGVYTKVIHLSAGSTITFKIAGNDQWNEYFNYGGADLITMSPGQSVELISDIHSRDITLTATKTGNLKFTIDINGDVPTLRVEDTTEEAETPPPPAHETYTVYAKIPYDWIDPRVWCWNDSAENPASLGPWPGSLAMQKCDNGWYAVEVPVGYNNLLINANGGGNQTPDMVAVGGQDIWINAYTDPTNPVFSYESPHLPGCSHPNHLSDGRCAGCGLYIGHCYDTSYYCSCSYFATDLQVVYFVNHTNYEEVYAYWRYTLQADDSNAPGVKMTAVADNIYSCWIPQNVPSVIFNDGNGNEITAKPLTMTEQQIVFNPLTSSWITYQQALNASNNNTPAPETPDESTQPATSPSKAENKEDTPSDNNAALPWIIVGAAAVVIVTTIVIILIIKKNRK